MFRLLGTSDWVHIDGLQLVVIVVLSVRVDLINMILAYIRVTCPFDLA